MREGDVKPLPVWVTVAYTCTVAPGLLVRVPHNKKNSASVDTSSGRKLLFWLRNVTVLIFFTSHKHQFWNWPCRISRQRISVRISDDILGVLAYYTRDRQWTELAVLYCNNEHCIVQSWQWRLLPSSHTDCTLQHKLQSLCRGHCLVSVRFLWI